jgi:hypothetical protein
MSERKNRIRVVPALVCLALFFSFLACLSSPTCAAVLEKITYTITGDVYLGDKNSFEKPCVITRKQVFSEIPEIQTIKREKLDKNSARYAFLIKQANGVFRKAVEDAAGGKGYDLVVERGGIKADDGSRISDITKAVIAAIPKS